MSDPILTPEALRQILSEYAASDEPVIITVPFEGGEEDAQSSVQA